MIRLSFVLCIVLLFAVEFWCVEFQQERAKLRYANPKYIANVSVLTRRVSRHEPYRTNLTFTALMPYGNNVTFALILQLKTGGDFKIQSKLCDCLKYKWMKEYMQKFTDIPLDKCPFPPGTYSYKNMELPPRDVPIPVMDGDYYSIMELSITATKELVLQAATLLHFDQYKNNKNKDNKGNKNKDNKTKDNRNKDNRNKDNKNKDNNKKG